MIQTYIAEKDIEIMGKTIKEGQIVRIDWQNKRVWTEVGRI